MTDGTGNGLAWSLNKDCTLSDNIIQLYQSAAVRDANEAITVLFHAFMLESEFIPKDVPPEDMYKFMPKTWNEKGVFKIKYEHKCCPPHTCYMTCVPLYSNICVHGIICDVDCSESVSITVNADNYMKEGTNISNVYEAFSNLDRLSRYFKDGFCLPLLNLFHETIGVNRFYGLRGLFDELKIDMLKLLPVETVVAMSAVNKNFHHLANSPSLWKYLFKRDFERISDGVLDTDAGPSGSTNWKQMYITKYKKKKEFGARLNRFPRIPFPQIFNVRPDYYDDGISIFFDPPPPEIFPSIHPMIPQFPFFRR